MSVRSSSLITLRSWQYPSKFRPPLREALPVRAQGAVRPAVADVLPRVGGERRGRPEVGARPHLRPEVVVHLLRAVVLIGELLRVYGGFGYSFRHPILSILVCFHVRLDP